MLWEDEPPADSRVRRMQQDAPLSGRIRRNGPGMPPSMPVDIEDPGDDEPMGVRRFPSSAPSGRWWRPASKAGRIILALGAITVLGGLVTVTLMFRNFLERDARFRIVGAAGIQASGLTEVSRADMLPVFGEDIGRNIFFVPLDLRRKQLEAIPWVQRATVMRLLPDQIRIAVVERNPVAFTRVGAGQAQQVGLVDADGVLLSMPASAMAQHHYSFPVVTGIDRGDPAAARKARMAVYLRMMSDLDSTGQRYSEQISEIDLTDPEDARVLMPEQGADILAHFGEDHFLERYQRYKAHIAEWRQQYPHLAAVDLRYDHQVVLQMASGKEASDDSAGANTGANGASGSSGNKPSPSQPAASAKPKPTGNGSAAARRRAAEQKKKRAEARRAALQTIHKNRTAPAAAEGE
ncbi:MAG TPA: FtsQ-type POTRA domain-containing protein [Terracidiphilus sp.]|jgi:cell division protein FtsQ